LPEHQISLQTRACGNANIGNHHEHNTSFSGPKHRTSRFTTKITHSSLYIND